jgi:cytochrome c
LALAQILALAPGVVAGAGPMGPVWPGPAAVGAVTAAPQGPVPQGPGLGQPLTAAESRRLDRHVFPDGTGLPAGQGTVAAGQALYQRLCVACHGPEGSGATADELAGGQGRTSPYVPPDKNIGTYWPYATTLFDFLRRAMPMDRPGRLTDDETYALTAYLLHLNGLLPAAEVLDAARLMRIRMPNRNGFIACHPHPHPLCRDPGDPAPSSGPSLGPSPGWGGAGRGR